MQCSTTRKQGLRARQSAESLFSLSEAGVMALAQQAGRGTAAAWKKKKSAFTRTLLTERARTYEPLVSGPRLEPCYEWSLTRFLV